MKNIARLPISDTEKERRHFEAWATSALRKDEAGLLTRSRGGDYVLLAARAGWAAWQARGLIDQGRQKEMRDIITLAATFVEKTARKTGGGIGELCAKFARKLREFLDSFDDEDDATEGAVT